MNREIPDDLITLMNYLAKNDLRVGQMFEVIFSKIKKDNLEPFYVENDVLLKYFQDFIKEDEILKNQYK